MTKEEYGIIYLIRNKVNGKVYVGQTIQGFKGRYRTELYKATHNEHLKKSIKKYGMENFEIIERFDVAYSKDELDLLEKKYIKEFNSTDSKFGYNKTHGGSGGLHTEESKARMKKQKTEDVGKPVVCVTNGKVFDCIADAGRYYNISQGSIIQCCKFKASFAGVSDGEYLQWLYYDDYIKGKQPIEIKLKKVICVTTGEVFLNITKAVEKYTSANIVNISLCCDKVYSTCGSLKDGTRLQWLYYDDYLNGEKPLPYFNSKIICVTTRKVFDNASEAAMYYDIDSSHIYENCRRECIYSGELKDGTKLQWLFYDDYLNGVKPLEIKDNRVVCMNTGEIFRDAGEASRKYNIDKSCINKVCRGERKSAGKSKDGQPLTWKRYVDTI